MKNTFLNKRIPTLLSIGLIGIGLIITSVITKNGVNIVSRADITDVPKNVKITNISDNGFTVSYTTDIKNIASLKFGVDENLSQIALDDNSQKSGLIRPNRIHVFTVKKIQPKTKYFFIIASGQKKFLNENSLYEVTTASTHDINLNPQTPIKGSIIMPDGTKPKEALVNITTQKTQEISTLSKDGNYLIELNSLLLKDLSYPANLNKDDIIKMIITDGNLTSNILITKEKASSVPLITLSKDYDFTLNVDSSASSSSDLSGFSSSIPNTHPSSSQNPDILVPVKDQSFTDQQPLFRGTTAPNEKVKIIINSEHQIEIETTADSSGNWFFRPKVPLSSGDHTISIQTKNKAGILQKLSESFVVLAAGSQIPGALPSPSPINSQTPTTTPSLTPTPTQTSTPTPTIAPTIVSVDVPTNISVQTTITPPLGNSSILITGIAGLSIIVFGILLFIAL